MTAKFHIELFNDYMTRALVYRHKAENVERVRQEHDRGIGAQNPIPPFWRPLEATASPGEYSPTICSRRAENPGGSHEGARSGEHSSRYSVTENRSQKRRLR